jgi:UDP-GlcNAc:undecaprenyl-phosphate/decaprenyl-phosphate GlcNAc-1-phosphate transferase
VEAVIAVLVAAPIAFVVAWLAKVVGPRVGMVDLPDGQLKTHRRPIVPLGGIGVAIGFLVASAVVGALSWSIAAAVVGVASLGLIDDRVSLSPKLRLVAELGAGTVLVAQPFLHGTMNALEALVGVAATVVLINAVNLYDGLDGLVSSSAAAGLLGVAVLALVWGDGGGLLALAGAGALIGFLPHNWNPAKMFLGDNGSYTVGTVLAAVIVDSAVSGRGLFGMIATATAGTVFMVDLVSTLWRRSRARVPLFAGDRSHTYDRLHDAGWSIKRVAWTSAVVNGTAAIAVALAAFAGTIPAALLAVMIVVALIGVAMSKVIEVVAR